MKNKFFKTQKEMDAYFGTQFGISDILYEDMSDDELKSVYETAKDENWSGVPFFDYTKK